jgi:hypothetical protein
MFDSPIVLVVALEIAVVLLLLCLFLLLHLRGLRRLVAALEAKVVSVRDTLRAARQDTKMVRQQLAEHEASPGMDYSEYVDAQIDATRNHHLSLDPDRDIVLDIAPDTTLERQAVALRHAFLVAEKEAWLAGESEAVDWAVLQGKLGQIIQFYQQDDGAAAAADSDELTLEAALDNAANEEVIKLQEALATQTRHMENLEKFKKLFSIPSKSGAMPAPRPNNIISNCWRAVKRSVPTKTLKAYWRNTVRLTAVLARSCPRIGGRHVRLRMSLKSIRRSLRWGVRSSPIRKKCCGCAIWRSINTR